MQALDTICQVTQLTSLEIRSCGLTSLSLSISRLSNLECLNLEKNHIYPEVGQPAATSWSLLSCMH